MRKSNTIYTPLPHLRAWRASVFLSQKELGQIAGVSKYTIINIENGKYQGAQNRVIRQISRALQLTPKQLIEEEPAP